MTLYFKDVNSMSGGGIPTNVISNIWFGTQAEFDLIDPKDEKTLYLIQEESATVTTLNMTSPRGISMNPQTRTISIEPSVEPEERTEEEIPTQEETTEPIEEEETPEER